MRRAELFREFAVLEVELAEALARAARPAAAKPDQVLTLYEAAAFMGEPAETFRRRLEYRKAVVSRPGELRLRFSRRGLDRILADRARM